MNWLRMRWILGVTSVVALTVIYWILNAALINSLRRTASISGIVLLAIILFLSLFNARKKLPFLPLLKASTCMQIHIYIGFFSTIVFLFHIGFRFPHGILECVLASLFVLVSFSGVFGLAISRWVPARLTLHGESLIFERIPSFRNRVKEDVERLVFTSVTTTRSTTIADFYERRLRAYFERPRHIGNHLLGYSKPLHGLLAEVEALNRYLNAEERKVMEEIAESIRLKDNLDFQLAGQGLLKGWLFVHIPLSYGLILISSVHGLLAWRFF